MPCVPSTLTHIFVIFISVFMVYTLRCLLRYYDRVMTIEFKAPGIKRQHAIKHRRAPKRPTHGSTSSTAEREKNRIDAASAAKRDAERRARFRLHHQDPMGARSAAAAVSAVSAVSTVAS